MRAHFLLHALWAAKTTLHVLVTIFPHHLVPEIVLTATTMMFHPANAARYKANEKDKSYNDKEPGNKSKEFAGHFFPEFCKQQSACQYCQQ
ncbi:MAG: hypothetical protein WCP32_16320 [Bacteroidota bacterium]